MSSSNTIKKNITGAMLKAAMTNPTVNTVEDVDILTGLFGAEESDTIVLERISFAIVQPPTAASSVRLPGSTWPGNWPTWTNPAGYTETYTMTVPLTGGTLSIRVQVEGSGVTLSDLEDSASFDLYLTGSYLDTTLGTVPEALCEELSVMVEDINTRSFANPSRSLNSAFQIDTDHDAHVTYSVEIASTLSVTTGQQGTVFLEYADDSSFTTNVKEIARLVNGNTGTLSLGLNNTNTVAAPLAGMVPAGKYVKLRTQNNTGTPTFTYRSGQEVLL